MCPVSITREEERRRRLGELANRLKKDKSSDLTRVVGWGALKWGARRKTVRDYLGVLEDAGVIVMDKETVEWVE